MRLKFYKDASGNILEFRERGLYKEYENSSNDNFAEMLVEEVKTQIEGLDLTKNRKVYKGNV